MLVQGNDFELMFRILGSARLPAGELPTCPGELHAHGEGLPCPRASMAPLRALLELLRDILGGNVLNYLKMSGNLSGCYELF